MNGLTNSETLRAHVEKKYGTQMEAAKAWGVSKSFVSHVLAGRRTPSKLMLKDAGIYSEQGKEIK